VYVASRSGRGKDENESSRWRRCTATTTAATAKMVTRGPEREEGLNDDVRGVARSLCTGRGWEEEEEDDDGR
jgi:hypothetical protein